MTVPLIIGISFRRWCLIGIPYAMSSMFGMGDVNTFEHILEPGHCQKKLNTRSIHSEGKKEVKNSFERNKTRSGLKPKNTLKHSPEEISTERWLALLSVF